MEKVRLGEMLNDSFAVVDEQNKPVLGLVDKDFERTLYGPQGADLSASVPVTISELGRGMYRLNFRPNAPGEWTLAVYHELFPAGQSGVYQVEEPEQTLEQQDSIEDAVEEYDTADLKREMAELIKVPVEDYDPSKLSNAVLGDDYRIALAWHAELMRGKKLKRSLEEVEGYMRKILPELVKRGKVTFRPRQMHELCREFIAEVLWESYGTKGTQVDQGRGIYLVPPHAQLVADGKQKLKLAQRDWKLDPGRFYGLLDGKAILGMVRFEDSEEMDEERFEKTKDEHRVTMDEVKAWGWKFPLRAWKVREFFKFEAPKALRVPKGKDKFVNLAMVKLEKFPEEVKQHGIEGVEDIVPENLQKLTPTQLVLLDAWLQASFTYSYRQKGREVEEIVNAALFVAEEKERRGMERRIQSPLDFAVERLRRGGLAALDETICAELRSLVDHAKDELGRAGLFDKDSDYGGALGKAVMAIMKLFARQGHSGFSAQMCRELFHKLANFETLTPITSEGKEWNDVSEMAGGKPLWQNERDPRMFSGDGGKTWYNVEDLSSDDDAPTMDLHEIKSGRYVYLQEVMQHLKNFYVSKPHIYLVGSLAINGRGRDIDVLIRGAEPDRVLEFRVSQMFPPRLRDRLRFLYDADGPFTSHIPLYAMKAETLGDGLVSMSAGDDSELQRLLKEPPMPADARQDIGKWKGLSRTELADGDPKKLPENFWVLEEHYRGKTAHDDFRVKQDGHLEGWTIAGQVKGAIPDVNTVSEAKAIDAKFDDPKTFKFRPGMDPAETKVFATRKAKQPLVWLQQVNRVIEPGQVGATKEEVGVFYGKDWGILWPGVKKRTFEEYFLYGRRFKGRLLFRVVRTEEKGRGLEPGLNFLAWMAKEQTPLLMTRRARVEKREDVPPDGVSWLPPNWEEAVPAEMRWWTKKGQTKARKLKLMDEAYNHFIESGILAGQSIQLQEEPPPAAA